MSGRLDHDFFDIESARAAARKISAQRGEGRGSASSTVAIAKMVAAKHRPSVVGRDVERLTQVIEKALDKRGYRGPVFALGGVALEFQRLRKRKRKVSEQLIDQGGLGKADGVQRAQLAGDHLDAVLQLPDLGAQAFNRLRHSGSLPFQFAGEPIRAAGITHRLSEVSK